MSKKSRRRNRRLLTALAALGGAAMLAGRGRKDATVSTPTTIMDSMPKGIDKVISDVPVRTPTTIQDSMPRVGMKMGDIQPKNVKSKRVMDDGRVFTIEGAKKGIVPKVGNVKTKFVGGDGKIFQGGKQVGEVGVTSPGISVRKDGSIMAKGVLYPNRDAYRNRNKMPSNLSRDMGMSRGVVRTPVIDDSFFSNAMAKDGGKIVKTETGGKAIRPKKKTRIQVRGFGKARR